MQIFSDLSHNSVKPGDETDNGTLSTPFFHGADCHIPGFSVVGTGRRHIVIGNRQRVLRIQKEVVSNTLTHASESIRFHRQVVQTQLGGFVCDQEMVSCQPSDLSGFLPSSSVTGDSLWLIQTRNLIGNHTIELKPKCALVERTGYPPRFVVEQLARKDPVIYDPSPIWSSFDSSMLGRCLLSAATHPKRYLRIHSWASHPVAQNTLVCEALHSNQGRDLLRRLEGLQDQGTDVFAKRALAGDPDVDETDVLIGRMAMDVSLMMNFFPPSCDDARIPELEIISLASGWTCQIGVVDTDLKHRWKLPDYATQLDTAIKKLES